MIQSTALEVAESETELVSRAQLAVSQCNWVVGECASKWTKKYARGRTDTDFGMLVGLSADQVFQRRRVWETFGDVSGEYTGLKWSHFYVSLNWNDAPECLQWAQENEATVAEMKAWRRATRGEEAEEEPVSEDWGTAPVSYASNDMRPVRDPDEFESGGDGGDRGRTPSSDYSAAMAGFARESSGELPPSASPPWEEGDEPASSRISGESARHDPGSGPSVEQLVRRMASTLEKFSRTINPEFVESFHELPAKLKSSFLRAAEEFQEKLADLGG